MNGFIWINSRYKIALIISMARQNSLIPWKTIIWFLGLMSILRMKEKTGKRSLLLLRNFIREFIKRLDVNIRIGWRQFGKNMMIFTGKERIINRANEYVGNDVQRMMHRLQASAVRDQKCKMHNVYILDIPLI